MHVYILIDAVEGTARLAAVDISSTGALANLNSRTRKALAGDLGTPSRVLLKVAEDADAGVRRLMASNPSFKA